MTGNYGSTSCAALSSYPAHEVVEPGDVVGVADAVKWCVRCPLAVCVTLVSDAQAATFDAWHGSWVVSEWLGGVPVRPVARVTGLMQTGRGCFTGFHLVLSKMRLSVWQSVATC